MRYKSILALIMSVFIMALLSQFSIEVNASELASGTCGNYGSNLTWILDDTGTLTISGTGKMQDWSDSMFAPWVNLEYSIRAVVVEDGVTSIGDRAFQDCSNMYTLTISDSVRSIGVNAFAYCTSLYSVDMGKGVTQIGTAAFAECVDLMEVNFNAESMEDLESGNNTFYNAGINQSGILVTFGSSVTKVPAYLFKPANGDGAPNIVSVEFETGSCCTSIGNHSFNSCENIAEVYLPLGITTIGEYAFAFCYDLSYINIPPSVTCLGNSSFLACYNLTSVSIDNVTEIGEWAFYNTGLTSAELGTGIASIAESVFHGCTNLKKISIPNNVTSIGKNAFYGCTALEEIYFDGSAPLLDGQCFTYVSATAYYPLDDASWDDSLKQNYGGSIKWVAYEKSYIVAEGTCGSELLWVLDSKGTLLISGTGPMNDYSFDSPWMDYCTEITSVVIEDGITYIGSRALAECTYITSITIPVSVTAIGDYAFFYCENLETITFPGNIVSIGDDFFYGCRKLTEVIFKGNAPKFYEYCFYDMVLTVYYPAENVTWLASALCDYGGTITWVAVSRPDLDFSGASLTLQHDLAINYKADAELFETYGYSSPYVEFEFNGEKKTADTYTIEGDRYVFTFCDIAPNQMNDTIYATLYATYDGVEYSSEPREYSVATYCYNMLEKCSTDEYAEFRTLLVDLLHYGAASQTYTDYKTAALVDAQLTDTQLAWGTSTDRTFETLLDPTYQQVETPIVSWKGAGLNLQDAVTMRLKFTAESIDGVVLVIESDVGYWRITSEEYVQTDGGYYAFFNGLNAGQMSEPVYMTFYQGDTPVSNTARYSIESYAFSNQNSDDTALAELLKAMMRYGDSAYAYVN